MPDRPNAARAAEIAYAFDGIVMTWQRDSLAKAITAALDEAEARGQIAGLDRAHDWLLDKCGDDRCPCGLAGEMHDELSKQFAPASQPSALDDLTATPADGRGE